jgi:hypothetical protein
MAKVGTTSIQRLEYMEKSIEISIYFKVAQEVTTTTRRMDITDTENMGMV